ncbi:hypothetical protein NIE88_02250 [Sporolactobacillus shoreicorticis]|uniref:Uncharacterized protein n=1 Tax=Sporolactobacillus shoreicorticis TaxID=1923877 RepID=A0ABW5S152_9BACL|nr:hypothetical protein [Sporolactobacillus shoreicorticis]MCO7124601.1 hypothetical protein [Sporolactobacillus shoreicorticis]
MADTLPDDGLLAATIVPMNPAVKRSTAAAENDVRQAVVAEEPVLPIRAGVDDATVRQFLLHPHENFTRNNGFMSVFHIILWHKAVVLDTLFGKAVNGVGFKVFPVNTLDDFGLLRYVYCHQESLHARWHYSIVKICLNVYYPLY